jgi:membrane associated rhomboid family serine protease
MLSATSSENRIDNPAVRWPAVSAVETCYRHPDRPTRVHCTRCGRPICPDCMTPAPVGHHCPTCVAEARRGTRRLRLRLRRPRSAALSVLGLNVVLFVVDAVVRASGRGTLLEGGAMVPILVAAGEWYRLITAMFLHIGLFHLLLNSFAIYVFGGLVEQALGTVRFLAVYLVTGFAASAASFAFGPPDRASVGASGAVFGLLGAWLAYNLRRRSLSLGRANIQWVVMLIGINLVLGLVVPRIDWLAHVGGLVAGVAAGFVAEGIGRRTVRVFSQVAGLTLVGAGAAILAVWRAADLTA